MTSHHPQSERTIRKTLVGTDRHTRLLGLVVVNGPLVSALVLIYVVVFSVLLQIGISRGQAHVISTIAVAMTLLPLRWRLVNWSERLLQREWQDSQSLIRDIADTLGRTIEPATINVLLTQSLPERLRLRSAVLWMLQPPDDRVFQPIEEHADPADELLAQGASALYMAHVKDYALVMMDADQAWAAPFLKRGITLLVPLRISKRLIGIYGFGPPVRQRDYPPHVIGVLLTLAPAIASALENARAYTKIARLNDKLCSLDQRKDEFIESIGHELRTPLTSLSLA
ncbi:MAG TPA: sensor histidine kinase, partial [Roseiflexaceae bacterium]|nr:sensor histidine kinase [Roseiflexaceae bacterium]